MKVTVKANTNIALVKYWGKRDKKLKLPLNNSISLTLDLLYTETTIEIIDNADDQVIFNNLNITEKKINSALTESENPVKKILKFADLFRNDFNKKNIKLKIITENNFPTASGLASSASGFAALAVALNQVLGLKLDTSAVSGYARLGSGSACRSVYGGFAEWLKGGSDDGSDSYAIQLANENYWDLRMLVCIVDNVRKDKSSTDGMDETVKTCPFYPAWLETVTEDLNKVREGIISRDIEKVGIGMEHNCLKMHSTMFTTRPAIIYWKPATLAIIHKVFQIRDDGIACYFTIDAGANVKILCQPEDVKIIKPYLEEIKEIKRVIECKPGTAPQVKSFL